MVYSLIEAAKEWLDENYQQEDASNDVGEVEESDKAPLKSSGVSLVEAKVSGGRWDFVIGIVVSVATTWP